MIASSSHNIQMKYIPAHKGYKGNEIADSLAKEGADNSHTLESIWTYYRPLKPKQAEDKNTLSGNQPTRMDNLCKKQQDVQQHFPHYGSLDDMQISLYPI